MPSKIPTDKSEDNESSARMEFDQKVNRSSIRYESSKLLKEKDSFPREVRKKDLSEKVGTIKAGKLSGQACSNGHAMKGSSVALPLGTYRKPWPSRKAYGVEELVKHMSHVPCYLQHGERGDNVQEKALNFGVLDWGLLERWAYHQKCPLNGETRESTSGSALSSSFSTSGSSSQLSRSMPSPSKEKQPSSIFHHTKPPVNNASQNQLFEKENSGNVIGFHDSKTTSIDLPTRHDQYHDSDCGASTKALGGKQDEGKKKETHLKANSIEVSLPLATKSVSLMLKNDNASIFTSMEPWRTIVVHAQDGRAGKEEKIQCNPHAILLAGEVPQLYHNGKGRLDHNQEILKSRCASFGKENAEERHDSFELLTNDSFFIETSCDDLSCDSFEVNEVKHQSTNVLHSCPLPCTVHNDEADVANALLSESVVPTVESKSGICEHRGQLNFAESSCNQFVSCEVQGPGQSEVKSTATAGRKLSEHLSTDGPKQMSRSSSLREGSSVEQLKTAVLGKPAEDKSTKNEKGRRSPLRRILDPLLRPKNHHHCPGSIAASPKRHSYEPSKTDKTLIWKEMQSLNGPCKSSSTGIDSTRQAYGNIISSNPVCNYSTESHQDERHVASTRQALLQVASKNNLPVFMISCCNNDALAATMTTKGVIKKDALECIYTIFSVNESKKKTMLWGNPGIKGKKHQFVSDVVGHMKVSAPKFICDPHGCYFLKEFVLLGAELEPTSLECVDSPMKSELAAVVIKVPHERAQSLRSTAFCRSEDCGFSPTRPVESTNICNEEKFLQSEHNNENLSQIDTFVMLPSGVHGLSTNGKPSPLIKRWRSGGSCDCGGWDEGCLLTILTGNLQECSIYSSTEVYGTTNGTKKFQLFAQGGSQEKHHVFSMVSFKEGMYTVDFRSSIALLQAFTICMAALHSMEFHLNLEERKSLHEQMVNDRETRASHKTQGPANYIPSHPPLSPVGRA